MNENKWGGVVFIILGILIFYYNYKMSTSKGSFGYYETKRFFGGVIAIVFGLYALFVF